MSDELVLLLNRVLTILERILPGWVLATILVGFVALAVMVGISAALRKWRGTYSEAQKPCTPHREMTFNFSVNNQTIGTAPPETRIERWSGLEREQVVRNRHYEELKRIGALATDEDAELLIY
jgi:hypothetical protein